METTMQNQPGSKLEELFLDELKEVYGAEQHQLQVLPLLKKAASSLKLKNVLASHLDDTREQISRLEFIFTKMGQPAEARISEAVLGITRDVEEVITATQKSTATRDAGIIVNYLYIEHYVYNSYH